MKTRDWERDFLWLQNQFEEVQKVAQIGNWSFDVKSGSIYWSSQMYKMFPEDPALGPPSYERHRSTIHKDDQQMWQETVEKCLRDGQPYTMRFRSIFNDKIIWVEAKGQACFDNGVVSGLFGTCQDISQRVQQEQERERHQRFLEAVLSNVPSMIFVKDYQDRLNFLLLNRTGENLLGLSATDLIGKNDFDFFPKDQAQAFVNKDKEVFERGEILKIEKEQIQTSRGQRWLRTYKVPTFNECGEPEYLIGISNDITEEIETRELAEKERQRSLQSAKLATLGQMSGGVAHEINNPLAIISGRVSLLRNKVSGPEKTNQHLDSIDRAVARISKIVSGLQKFSRSSASTEKHYQSLRPILAEIEILSSIKAKKYLVDLKFSCHSQSAVLCNEMDLMQVFVNLMNNALDAVKDLPVRWIEVELSDQSDGAVCLKVIDSGLGIDPKIESKIFDPFFTTKEVGEGSGLGLSISKGILDDHRAQIHVLRQKSHTCFEILFPKEIVQKLPKAA